MRTIPFKHIFHLDYKKHELVEYLCGISEDEAFVSGNMHINVVIVKTEPVQEKMWLTQVSVQLTKGRDREAETPATWFYDYGLWSEGERREVRSDYKPYSEFKHAWIRVATKWDPNLRHDIVLEVYGELVVESIEKPPEKPPEKPLPPSKPEKPSEPFDLGKWIEWGLRNILRDEEPPTCRPHNTWLLASLLTVIYLHTVVDFELWASILGLIPSLLFSEPWRLFTYMWLHAPIIDIYEGMVIPHAHLAFNVLFLWVFGDNVECRLGYAKYIIYYILSGIIAGLGQVAWLHMIGLGFQPIVIIGASGAVSGIMGLYLSLFPENNVVFAGKHMKAYWFLIAWFIGQISMLFMMELTIGVAAHITGFLLGLVLGEIEKHIEIEVRILE